MIRKLISWYWLRVTFRISSVNARIARLERDRVGIERRLGRKRKSLERLVSSQEDRLSEFRSEIAALLEESKSLERRLREELEIARNEARVNEAAINALTAQSRMLLERWDAETAIQIRRRVAAETPRE